MSDDYENVSKGSLKLKNDHGIKKKKKKKKSKELKEEIKRTKELDYTESDYVETKTKAELAYERIQKQKADEKILKRAALTHKEKIIKFNKHLDGMTEHFDMPKLSWTK
ncbi:DgyrCDS7842 [Dimorphilus gyrociliatus]|uniref:DgyrCDS7842 n=1 Tax=Dimorphilus gyrociliatus TaxID=2664684 RepID=A0A7I8VSE1_9ANNE|nr:DgyrCDS7842 [Dimorphilus gyrociliatus]